ncbi:MAG: DUF268 domain-containing protein [Saprospiraceae bacterium]
MGLIKNVVSGLRLFGIDPRIFMTSLRGLRFYFKDLSELKNQMGTDKLFPFGRKYPVLGDRNSEAGVMSGHYFHQDLFVASKIYEACPIRHLDIGSRIDGFVAHVAIFREIEIMDIRPQISKVKNIIFRQQDLMQLPEHLNDSYDSISSLHVIEHFGLGRYGDPIDYNGYLKAIQNITSMLKTGGVFYFSVPIGPQRIEFNGQRVFSVKYLLQIFKDDFFLNSFSYVDDAGDFFQNVTMPAADIEKNFGCQYGCGIFELVRK